MNGTFEMRERDNRLRLDLVDLQLEDPLKNAYTLRAAYQKDAPAWRANVTLPTLSLADWEAFVPEITPVVLSEETSLDVLECELLLPAQTPADWQLKARTRLTVPSMSMAGDSLSVTGIVCHSDLVVNAKQLQGAIDLTAKTASSNLFAQPLEGFSARGMNVEYDFRDRFYSLQGRYRVDRLGRGPVDGDLTLNSRQGYRVRLNSANLDPSEWLSNLAGEWKTEIVVEGNLSSNWYPSFALDLTGRRVSWGKHDLTRRLLSLSANGKWNPTDGIAIDKIQWGWGKAFEGVFERLTLSSQAFFADYFMLKGDVLVIREFLPDVVPNPRLGRWVEQRQWSISGALEYQYAPAQSLRISNGKIEGSSNLHGPFNLVWESEQGGHWRFQSPQVTLPLDFLPEVAATEQFELNGQTVFVLDLVGTFDTAHSPVFSILSGNIKGEISDCDGMVFSFLVPDRKQAVCSWENLAGQYQLDWRDGQQTLSCSIQTEDWTWHTKPPYTPKPHPKELDLYKATLDLDLVRSGGHLLQIKKCDASLGRGEVVELSLDGTIDQTRSGDWNPDLQVRIDCRGNSVVSLFRGIKVMGNATLQGKITGNNTGNWLVDANLDCNGFSFEQVVAPVVFHNVRGTMYLRDVALDERFSLERFEKRPHPLPPSLGEFDSLSRAFDQSSKTPVNLVADEMLIGSFEGRNVALRTIWIGDILYFNTMEGNLRTNQMQSYYDVKLTGFAYFHPLYGPGWEYVAAVDHIPLSDALPLRDSAQIPISPVRVRQFSKRKPPQDSYEVREVILNSPVRVLRGVPALGPLMNDLTSDLLDSSKLVFERRGDGNWRVLNPVRVDDLGQLPRFLVEDFPQRVFDGSTKTGQRVFDGIRDGVGDTLDGGRNVIDGLRDGVRGLFGN